MVRSSHDPRGQANERNRARRPADGRGTPCSGPVSPGKSRAGRGSAKRRRHRHGRRWHGKDGKRRSIHRCWDLAPQWRHVPYVGDDCIEIRHRQDLVKVERHDRRKGAAVRTQAVRQCAPDIGVSPIADAGLPIGRDVRAHDRVGRIFEGLGSTGKLSGSDQSVRPHRRVAEPAGHYRIYKIVAAFKQRLRVCGRGQGQCASSQETTK